MGYEILLQVAIGTMIGMTIALFLIVRRIVEMQRCMEGLAMTLASVISKAIPKSNDPYGGNSESSESDSRQSISSN